MRNQRQVALAHSGVKLTGPAQGYGRKKELQVRQWISSLPTAAVNELAPANEDQSGGTDFEDLPPLVQELYRQLTDSTDGLPPPAIDEAPTYPNSNIPRRPTSPVVANTPPTARRQSRVPLPPDSLQTISCPTTAEKPQQQQSPLKRSLDGLNPATQEVVAAAAAAAAEVCVDSPVQSAASSRFKTSGVAAASSFVVSVSTLDPVSEHGSGLPNSVARQPFETADEATLELLLKALDISASLRSNVQNAAEDFMRQAHATVDDKELVLHAALLQAVAAHEKYKDQVRLELEQARRTAASAGVAVEAASEQLRRKLNAETARAEKAENSLQDLQAVALQEKKKIQTLKNELEEECHQNAKLGQELELATQQLQKSATAQAESVKQMEARLQQARHEAKQATERAAAAQKQQELVQKRLEAQVSSLDCQLQACTSSVSELKQEQAKLKGQLASEAKARAAAEQAEKAALRSLQEQAEVTAAMQETMANSWLLQQRQNSSAARLAVLTNGTSSTSQDTVSAADAKKSEGVSSRLERANGANSASVAAGGTIHRTESKDLGLPLSPNKVNRISVIRKADVGQAASDTTRAGEEKQRQSTQTRHGSGTKECRLPSGTSNDNTPTAKDSAGGRQLSRSTTSERRLLAEAQKAERRAAANAMLEESKLQEVALEAAPPHLRHLGIAFRAGVLVSDNSWQATGQSLADKLSNGYRTFADPVTSAPSPTSPDQPWTGHSNPLIPLCQAVVWLATQEIPSHICDQLAQACTHGRRLVILTPPSIHHPPVLDATWLTANSATVSTTGTSTDTVVSYVTQAWEQKITLNSTSDAHLDAALAQVALRLGVCDGVLSLLPSAALKRAAKSLQPDLLHLNLPGLAHLNLEGNSMPQLSCSAFNPEAPPALSLGTNPTADLCYALQQNSTIKLLTAANLPTPVLQALTRAVCAEGCGVITLHTHNDLPVAALMGRGRPCNELVFTRPLSSDDAAALSILLPNCISSPTSITIPGDTSLPSTPAATLCSTICALPNLQRLNDLDLSALESIASGCSTTSQSVLDLGGCVLGPFTAQILAQRLRPYAERLVNVTRLNATACQLAPGGIQQLMCLVGSACSHGNMQVLCLADNKCGPEGVSHLAGAFSSPITSLAVLDLSMNCLSNDGATILGPLLPKMPNLRCLGLGHNALSSDGLKSICSSLTCLDRLQELQLGGNVLGDEGMGALAASLRSLPNLQVLSLQDNYNLGVETGRCLGSALPSCTSLRHLNLAKAHLGPEGARHLAAGIANAPSLTTLNLELCKIRAAGAAALAGPVSTATCLEEFILARNSIGDAGASALAQALSKSTSLTRLDLRNNGIGQLGFAALKALISRPKCPIRSIVAAGNREDANLSGLEDLVAGTVSIPEGQQGAATSRTSRGQVGPQSPSPALPNSRLQSPDLTADKASKLNSRRASPNLVTKPHLLASKSLPASSLMDQWRAAQPPSLPSPDRALAAQSSFKAESSPVDGYTPNVGTWTEADGGGRGVTTIGKLGESLTPRRKLGESSAQGGKLQGERSVGKGVALEDLIPAAREGCETSSDSLEAALERYRKR